MEIFSYTYPHESGIDLYCTFEYEPAETGSTENGLKMEPDYPSVVILISAKLNGEEISPFLGYSLIDEIEDKAKVDYESREIDV